MATNEADITGSKALGRRPWPVLAVLAAVALLGIVATLAVALRNAPTQPVSVSADVPGIDRPVAPTGSGPFIDHSVVESLPVYEEPDTGASIAAYGL